MWTAAIFALLVSACTISVVVPFEISDLSVSTDYEEDDGTFYICDDATTEVTYRFSYEGTIARWTQELQEYKDGEFTGRTTLQRTVRPENSRATVTDNEVTFRFLVDPGEALEPQGVSPQQIRDFVDTRLLVQATSADGQSATLTTELPTRCYSDTGFGDATDVSVSSDFSEVALRDILGSGETRYYRVDLSESVAADNDLVIVEANAEGDDPFRVTAYNQEGGEVLASVSSDSFARASAVRTADIDANQVCAGPCVAVLADGSGSAYFSVENTGGEKTFDLFAVATPFIDTTEPNGSLQTPAQVSADEEGEQTQAAAVEFVGDEDFFQSAQGTTRVSLVGSPPELNLEFDVYTESGRFLGSGDAANPYLTPEEEPAQRLLARVFSGDERAAVGANANYTILFDREVVPVSVN